ncbi:Thiol:disulfide interchange protein DsbE [Asticcacaulis sp. MM231]|uniref:redoxin family protein n=1 Tax=Asticcacaulis sp. MM231 TaxID=3157666 RepID=UPI0032D589DB
MKRLIYFAPLVLFVGLLAVLAYYNFHKKTQYEPREMVGKSVPEVVLNDVQDGTPASLKALVAASDKPVMVNFFASWCAPCISENPQLMGLKAKGVTIIGIAWKDEPQNTLKFLAQHDNPFVKTLSDPEGKMALAFGNTGVPETYIVMPDGTITDKISGPIVPDTFDAVYAEVSAKR